MKFLTITTSSFREEDDKNKSEHADGRTHNRHRAMT